MRRTMLYLAAAASCLATSSCGAAQDRPAIVAVFPADGQILSGWLGYVRVTYDQAVTVLNDRSAALAGVVSGGLDTRIYADPSDDHSILVKPDRAGHFFPNEQHHLVIRQGAVVNAKDHYALDEFGSFFTVGAPPDLFVASSDGKVYELDPATAAQVHATAPLAGTKARDPVSTEGRVWVWLDPSPGPGDSVLGTFTPGTATVAQTVTLSGEVGARTGGHLVVSTDGRTVYASVRDAGTNRLRLHRVDAATQTELGSIELSPALSGPTPVWQPAVDPTRNRLYLPFTNGTDGVIAVVDLTAFAEVDAGPLPGVDAAVIPDGAGDVVYESTRDRGYMIVATGPIPRFVVFNPNDFALVGASEPALVGAPVSLFVTPDDGLVMQGLSGYAAPTSLALVEADTRAIDQGFAAAVTDDVGAGPRGSTRLGVLLRDPAATRLLCFLDNGSVTSLAAVEWLNRTISQTDLNTVAAGTQSLDLSASAPGVTTGATFLYGPIPP